MKNNLPQWTPSDDKMEELKSKKFSPTVFLELFFDDKLFDLMLEETNRCASQNNKNFNVTKEKLKFFIGILLLSGYMSALRRRLFWETAKDATISWQMQCGEIALMQFLCIFTCETT